MGASMGTNDASEESIMLTASIHRLERAAAALRDAVDNFRCSASVRVIHTEAEPRIASTCDGCEVEGALNVALEDLRRCIK